MTVRYVSQDLEWTDSMRVEAQAGIVVPLRRYLRTGKFELSLHFQEHRGRSRSPHFELWAVLQTFDGRHNEVVRREGSDFSGLVSDVAGELSALVKKSQIHGRLSFLNIFKLPVEKTAYLGGT